MENSILILEPFSIQYGLPENKKCFFHSDFGGSEVNPLGEEGYIFNLARIRVKILACTISGIWGII